MDKRAYELEAENKKMREVLEFANYNLSRVWHSLREGKDINLLDEVGTIGTHIENVLNEINSSKI